MGLISRASSRTYRNKKVKQKKHRHGTTWTKETFENLGGTAPLDAPKNRRRFQLPTKCRPTQAPRVPSIGHLHSKSTPLRPHRKRVPEDHDEPNDQGRR